MISTAKFDLVILGSGSTAFAAALRAQELGKTVVMTEERTIGGTCVNRGRAIALGLEVMSCSPSADADSESGTPRAAD